LGLSGISQISNPSGERVLDGLREQRRWDRAGFAHTFRATG